MKRALLIAALVAAPALAQSNRPAAALADTQLADASQEREAKALMETLRCIVCQGQSIADSDAEMAGDMRALVRERIGRGDYVTYDPPLSAATAPLWIAPFLLLGIGALIAARTLRRRRR